MGFPDYLLAFFYNGSEAVIGLSYAPGWVLFSILLAITGTSVATAIATISGQLTHRVTRQMVQLTGAIAFGAAVWGMHFVGMLAVSMPMEVTYDPLITLGSAIPAIAAAWIAINWLAQTQTGLSRKLITAAFIAIGIGTMHYTGMFAMRMQGQLQFEPVFFMLSLVVAFLLSLSSILLIHSLRTGKYNGERLADLAGGVGFGLAIAGMHYTAMLSARVIGTAEFASAVPPYDRNHLISLIALGLFAALGISYAGSLATRLRVSNRELRLQREQLNQIIQQSMNSVLTLREDGTIETVNAQTEHLFREAKERMLGKNIRLFIPDWNPNIKELELIGVHDRECIGRRSDEVSVNLILRKSMIRVDDQNRFILFIVDISEFKQTERELYHQATHDALTGAFNRRHMESTVVAEYGRCRRHQHALTLMMLDIDHFKSINDNYGHDVGDKVLREFAERLQQEIRKTDILCRVGGEEFLLILPETENSDALQLAEKLRRSIAEASFNTDKDSGLSITVSVGVYTSLGKEAEGFQEVIQRADRALYQAKASGRNRVVNYELMRVLPTAGSA